MKRSFAETPMFRQGWKSLGLCDEQLKDLQNELIENPRAAPVIQNTGGVRKTRIATGRGKSGGARVLYVDFPDFGWIVLLLVYPKNKKDNISAREKKIIKAQVEQLKSAIQNSFSVEAER